MMRKVRRYLKGAHSTSHWFSRPANRSLQPNLSEFQEPVRHSYDQELRVDLEPHRLRFHPQGMAYLRQEESLR